MTLGRRLVVSQMAEQQRSRREPPPDLVHQHREVTHRLQWQKAQLERASPALLSGDARSDRSLCGAPALK